MGEVLIEVAVGLAKNVELPMHVSMTMLLKAHFCNSDAFLITLEAKLMDVSIIPFNAVFVQAFSRFLFAALALTPDPKCL